jgi:hypothetical protein
LINDSACPIEYRYSPSNFQDAALSEHDAVYVVGGLYGNIQALHEILRMQEAEARQGVKVSLVFNGDHNWFNRDAASFSEINQVVLQSVAIRGNVEAEFAAATDAGCGCNYPDYVNAEYAARSNAIMSTLRQTASQFSTICAGLNSLPLIRTVKVGEVRVGVVHGDAETLSGWNFAAERLSSNGKCCSGDDVPVTLTPQEKITSYFRLAGVQAFASTHTCLAHARDYAVDGEDRLIINNGAAGLPNFANSSYGLVTRIALGTKPAANSLYGYALNGTRFDAIPVHYSQTAFISHFINNWAPGSPAYDAYFNRVVNGPDFDLADAMGGRVARSY